MKIKLTQKQFKYLQTNLFSKINKDNFISVIYNKDNKIVIEITEDNAELIWEWSLEELDEKGFDNDEPNENGKILEDLIDLFYTG